VKKRKKKKNVMTLKQSSNEISYFYLGKASEFQAPKEKKELFLAWKIFFHPPPPCSSSSKYLEINVVYFFLQEKTFWQTENFSHTQSLSKHLYLHLFFCYSFHIFATRKRDKKGIKNLILKVLEGR